MAGAGPEERLPGRRLWPSGHRDRDTEEIQLTSKPTQPVGCLGKGSGALQDTAPSLFPGPLSSCFGPRPGELEGTGRKPGSTSYLTLHLRTTAPLTVGSLTVAI